MSMYSEVQDLIDGLSLGQTTAIDMPTNIKAFRKYLSEISRKDHKKFITKVIKEKLHIMRIDYQYIIEKPNDQNILPD